MTKATLGGGLMQARLTFRLDDLGVGSGDQVVVVPNAARAVITMTGENGAKIVEETGYTLPLARRSLPYAVPALAISDGVLRDRPIVLEAQYFGDRAFRPTIRNRQAFDAGYTLARLIEGLFIGALLALLCFNVFAFFGLREDSSIYFALFVLSLVVNEIVTTGLGDQYLWPTFAPDARLLGLLANSIGFASFVVFARSFLSTRTTVRRLDVALIAVTVVQLGVAALQYALPIGRALTLPLFAIEIAGSLLVAAIGIVRWRQGYHPARFFVIAFIPSTIGVIANLYYDAFLPVGNWFLAQNGVEIGTALEAIIITCSIVDRMRILDRARRHAQHIAETDGLTAIANRTAFYDTLQRVIEKATPATRFGILYVDLDGFKPINDRFGHRMGDQLLRIIARRLVGAVRPTDLVARIGGDEFGIFLADLPTKERLDEIAEKCRNSISDDIVIDGNRLAIRASVGTAMFPENGKGADDLVDAADRDMYREKHIAEA